MAVLWEATSNKGEAEHSDCFHCGEPCSSVKVSLNDKNFCCEGCRTVFQILNAHDLCQYYQHKDRSGWQVRHKPRDEYAYLDDEQVRSQLLDFSDGQTTRVHFELPQMHCASCIWLLEKLYKLDSGIVSSRVHFLQKTLFLHFDEAKTSLRKLVELLDTIGYPPSICLKDLEEHKGATYQRKYLFKLGVAGFVFGNIMLLSFPEYLGLDTLSEGNFSRFFGYLNILLAIPIVFYSGLDYLRSACLGLLQRQLNIDVPISIGIITLFVRSVYDILSHSGSGYLDSLSGLVFFLLIGKWFQQRTQDRITFDRDYRSYFPIAANKVENGKMTPTSLDQLQVGDHIQLKNQELIPADAVLVKGEAKIDYSFVTGESELVIKPVGEKLFAGGRQVGEPIVVCLIKSVSQSYLTSLWNEATFTKDQASQASKLANKIGSYFTVLIIMIAVATLLYWLPINPSTGINAFTSVLIIACPCAVALAIPFIFGNVLSILGRQQFYLKNTNVIEALDTIGVVVFDKTGTLTNREKASVSYQGNDLSLSDKRVLYALTHRSNHPKSQAIANCIRTKQDQELNQVEWAEVPGKGIIGRVDNKEYKLGSASWLGLSSAELKGVYWSREGDVRGCFQVGNTLRLGANQLFDYFRPKADLHLLSGDHSGEAYLFSQKLPGENLHFQQSPHDKLAFIKHLQKKHPVLMFGDGLNDAGALQQSDVGIVITENTNNFTPASDAILAAEQLAYLPNFLAYAQKSIRLVYGAYGFAICYNIIGLTYAVQGLLSPVVAAILMPLSSISIALYGLLSSSGLAWKMGLAGGKQNKR